MSGELAGVIITVTFFITTAAVVLLRPISRRFGEYLEALVAEKRAVARAADDGRVQRALEEMNRRLALLEERVEFAEHLIVPAAPGDAERRIGPAPTGDGERR